MTVFYLVTLNKPFDGVKEWAFGSLSAIYESLPGKVIGVKLARLYKVGVATGSVYSNKNCTIQQNTIIRKKTKRGNKNGRINNKNAQ